MWLRHALDILAVIILISACSPKDRQSVDKLNSISYAYHYRDIDSTAFYAQQAFDHSDDYPDGKAEALNHLAFVRIIQMNYAEAKSLLDEVAEVTDNQLELLVSYIQQMRLCQRQSRNREFYDYREQARRALQRINEERASLDERQQKRLVYAESELAIVTSTYYYYIGLPLEAIGALDAIGKEVEQDTAQYLNYLYNIGAGGIVSKGTEREIKQTEFDHLMRCLLLAEKADYPYFIANSKEALAEHLLDSTVANNLISDNLPAFKYLNPIPVPDQRLPIELMLSARSIFYDYGDVYQIAGANRTLASCYLAQNNYYAALEHLQLALQDTLINQAPDLVASIREQMSVAFAAIDDKPMSDQNRNIYLDMQEKTRQDRSLEAQAGQLEHSLSQLNRLLWAVGLGLLLTAVLVAVFFYLRRHRLSRGDDDELQERESELREQLALAHRHLENSERRHVEQRAKVQMVNTITPFIDRIIHEVSRLDDGYREERLEYIRELTDKINEQNDVLTHWIQLRQGELNLHIESFSLQSLFDMLGKSKTGFRMKNITLDIQPTDLQVKADRVLTLFMLNTLADNARKFTEAGGHVTIKAEDHEQYVELSVIDTGMGMDEEQLAHVFEHHAIRDDKSQNSHGFGLLNCKGIIEKYKKVSQIFSVCLLAAESRKGEGSRFYFRLPKGGRRSMAVAKKGMLGMMVVMGMMGTISARGQVLPEEALSRASAYADSAYFSNINGTYERTILFADSCRYYLNEYYLTQYPSAVDTLQKLGDLSKMPPEISWYHHNLKINYAIILSIRNESAVAALALHEWALYQYNNRIYTLLFKDMSADKSLADNCRKMLKSENDKRIAIFLLVLLFIFIIAGVLWQVVQMLNKSTRRKQEHQLKLELMEDELQKIRMEEDNLHVVNAVLDNCLSTLKHETMYFPSRIRQLIDRESDGEALTETVEYYRDLYGILSQQAMNQLSRTKMHLARLDHDILGDPVLVDYLFDILGKQAGSKSLAVNYVANGDKYIVCEVEMPSLQLTEKQAAELFTSNDITNIPYLICRQIVRDHGEATNRRGCAVRAELRGGQTVVVISLPRYDRPTKEINK